MESKHNFFLHWRGRASYSLMMALTLLALTIGVSIAQETTVLTRLTVASDPARDSGSSAFNYDGSKLVFSSDSDFLGQGIVEGQQEIWLYDTFVRILNRLTTASESGRGSFTPTISGDGLKVAFVSDSDFLGQGIANDQNEIWLYDLTSQALTRITTASAGDRDSFSPSLNEDGSKVAFYSDSDFQGQGIPAGQREIWLYDVVSQTLARITTASASDRVSVTPQLNADGTKIAFASDSDFLGQGIPQDHPEIWLYNTATTTLTRVTTAGDSVRESYSPTINAAGTQIAFNSDGDFLGQGIPDNQFEIWLYDVASTTLSRITTATHHILDSLSPSLSADGGSIVFTSRENFLGQPNDGAQEIWLYDIPATMFRRITAAPDSDRQSYQADVNGDGTKIAFSSSADLLGQTIPAGQYEVWLYEEAINVTVNPGVGGTLVYTDTQGNLTRVEIPAGAVTETTTVAYSPVDPIPAHAGLFFAGHGFSLEASRNGIPLPGFSFALPVTVTIDYSDEDVLGLDESTLDLRYWDGTAWVNDGVTVIERDVVNNRLGATLLHLSTFALFSTQGAYQIFLPVAPWID